MKLILTISIFTLTVVIAQAQLTSQPADLEIIGRTIPGTRVIELAAMRKEIIQEVITGSDGYFNIKIRFWVNLSYGSLGEQHFNMFFLAPDSGSARINIVIPDQASVDLHSKGYLLKDTIVPQLEANGSTKHFLYPEIKWSTNERCFRYYNSSQLVPAGGMRTIFENIQFHTGSSELDLKGMKELDKLIAYLKTISGYTLLVNGYTDNIGSDRINIPLSEKRARVVAEYLISKGISSQRIKIFGKGSSDPLVQNSSDENRRKNRRVEVLLKRAP